MNVLIDMNLSPLWVAVLNQAGFEAIHWSAIGRPDAPDSELMRWATENKYIVFTHDLDFGDILAATNADSPSVIQMRTQDISPTALGAAVVNAMNQFRQQLVSGALVVIDLNKARVRILPICR